MFHKFIKSMALTAPKSSDSSFQSMLADGDGDIKLVSGFDSVKSLYNKLGAAHNISPSDILFCTLNTNKVNMTALLSTNLEVNDVIFVHRAGERSEVLFDKEQDGQLLGITVTDNGDGVAFVKKIKEESPLMLKVFVGDHIQEIDGVSMLGMGHAKVVEVLVKLARGKHTLTIIKPIKKEQ
ncbi:PDZ domain-containing protein GIPC1-like [Folsomia candida]|uniref:PDZ domain-containing protein GIPC1-like n=1 Tax=Folsomia candida TaxID=158441 RepID=UPI000B8F5D86|nr:PDZ domain-containing protein GIPC1-like [Folsomia candida]